MSPVFKLLQNMATQKKGFDPMNMKLPFPLVVIQGKKHKKKCCKKYKKGNRCKSCPNG